MNNKTQQDLAMLKQITEQKKISELFGQNPQNKEPVALLQRLLNLVGYGEFLNWEKYKDDGVYGDGTKNAIAAFVKDIAQTNPDLCYAIVSAIAEKAEKIPAPSQAQAIPAGEGLKIKELSKGGKTRLYVSLQDITANFVKFKKGLYTFGQHKPAVVAASKKADFQAAGLSESEINVIMAVSENEGKLDAVNTWDNCFLTFGMFQWTIGSGNNPGELPALLKKIKDNNPDVFDKYYGRYGIDIESANSITGFLSFEGKKVESPVDKNRFREPNWAFYFWLSGQDPVVQTAQIAHAASRIKTFYSSDHYKVKGYYISQIINSEYGVALILDNHVNRPGYIKGCLEQAINETGLQEPAGWKDEDEQRLINAYLKIRETYGHSPMTHAKKRGESIAKYRDNNILSDKRGTFKKA